MTRDQIRQRYAQVANRIENDFSGYDVPPDVQHYYLLCELIALGSFESFVRRYGRQPIDCDFAALGKSDLLGLGEFTPFEQDVCRLWEKHVAELERQDSSRPRTFLPGR